ncbi:MAG TPA: DUF4097 family beta strand repeat-containing protein [Vicinamibacterales bacterium]|nr:DUF4097 family beta strand repeat-containing protein [Vicinamibacterales bacterium]
MTTQNVLFGAVLALGLVAHPGPAAVQQSAAANNWCADQSWGDDRQGTCDVREYTVPGSGATLTVDAAPNGGIEVEGSARGDVHVLARVVATADTADRARAIASGVQVVATPDRVHATGPRTTGHGEGWSVSYRLAVPTATPLSLQTTNGGIRLAGLNSQIDFRTTNGGVKLSGLGGDVHGRTTNGGVDIELDGASWNGGGLDVQTTNGGVRLAVPEGYSAHLETGTENGGVHVDFPITVQGSIGRRHLSTDLGGGGPTLRVQTTNGGVTIRRP